MGVEDLLHVAGGHLEEGGPRVDLPDAPAERVEVRRVLLAAARRLRLVADALVQGADDDGHVNMTAKVTIWRRSETAKLKSGGMKKNSNETTPSTAARSDGP